jgi:uncharacterized protein YukE
MPTTQPYPSFDPSGGLLLLMGGLCVMLLIILAKRRAPPAVVVQTQPAVVVTAPTGPLIEGEDPMGQIAKAVSKISSSLTQYKEMAEKAVAERDDATKQLQTCNAQISGMQKVYEDLKTTLEECQNKLMAAEARLVIAGQKLDDEDVKALVMLADAINKPRKEV